MNHISPQPPDILTAARSYVAAGISVVPIKSDGSKAPATGLMPLGPDGRRGWKQFRERLPTEQEIEQWFGPGGAVGIGVVCGAVSGGLEAIDFDNIEVVAPWANRVADRMPAVGRKLVLVCSPRPGIHAYFRSDRPMPSGKLARHLVLQADKTLAERTLIETRGEGGCIVAPPSAGGCHPSGQPYVYWSDRDLTQVERITDAEREVLLAAARELDELPPVPTPPRPQRRQTAATGDRPGDIFNARSSWPEILEPAGWSFVRDDTDGVQFWRRPGKTKGTSATVNYAETDCFYVFSQNAHPFEAGVTYTKFTAYAMLYHNGDFAAAAADLSRQGYGATLPAGRRSGGRRNSSRAHTTVSVSIPLPRRG